MYYHESWNNKNTGMLCFIFAPQGGKWMKGRDAAAAPEERENNT